VIIDFFRDLVLAWQVRCQVDAEMRAGRPVDIGAAVLEGLDRFPEQRFVQEVKANTELYMRGVLGRRLHDA